MIARLTSRLCALLLAGSATLAWAGPGAVEEAQGEAEGAEAGGQR